MAKEKNPAIGGVLPLALQNRGGNGRKDLLTTPAALSEGSAQRLAV